MNFQLWPAIDLLDGQVVRLRQGDYKSVTTYDQSITSLLAIVNSFADGLHIVDLNGARAGTSPASAILKKILANTPLRVELGGGLRTSKAIADVIDLGVTRAIIGSRAVSDPAFVKEAIEHFGDRRIVIGVDLKDGKAAVNGWTKTEDVTAENLLHRLAADGVSTVIVTDISTDGMMQGPNVDLIDSLTTDFPELTIIASGGVTSIDDLQRLQDAGAAGAVFGRAWIEGTLPLEALQEFAIAA